MIELTIRTEYIALKGDEEYFLTHVWADDYQDFCERLDLAIELIVQSAARRTVYRIS